MFDAFDIRPIRPEDKPLMKAGFATLSDESRRARFLTPKPRLTSTDLRYLTEVDGHDHAAFVAVTADRVVGVARYVREAPGSDVAEFAVIVADDLQGRGLGTALTERLVDVALGNGVTRFTATTLSDNEAVQRVIARIARRLSYEQHDGLREIQADLAA